MKSSSLLLMRVGHYRKLLVKRKTEVIAAYVVLLILFVAAACMNSKFLRVQNQLNLVIANIGLLLASFAQLGVVMLGGVDLSVGSIISVVNVVCVKIMTENPASWCAAVLASLGIGLAIGLLNGLLVAKGNLQPIIATLTTQTFFAGVALLIMVNPGGTLPSKFCRAITHGMHYAVPILLCILSVAVMWAFVNRTGLGRSILAVGGNEQSAKSFGISVNSVKMKTFAISGLLAALAGIYISAYATSGNPLMGEAYTQRSITAVVVGGASLAGGKGSVIGCIAAVLILGLVNNLLNLKGVSSYYQYVLQGVILMVALAFNAVRYKKN